MLNSGGFGSVYEALHVAFQYPCAVKKIPKERLENNQTETKLLWQEIEALDKFDHPNIVKVLDFLED